MGCLLERFEAADSSRRVELDDGDLAAVRGGVLDRIDEETQRCVVEQAAYLDHRYLALGLDRSRRQARAEEQQQQDRDTTHRAMVSVAGDLAAVPAALRKGQGLAHLLGSERLEK